jgi:hypothetical protein
MLSIMAPCDGHHYPRSHKCPDSYPWSMEHIISLSVRRGDLAMGKPILTIQNLGRVFNSRSGCMNAAHLFCYEVKMSDLELKTRPKTTLRFSPVIYYALPPPSLHLSDHPIVTQCQIKSIGSWGCSSNYGSFLLLPFTIQEKFCQLKQILQLTERWFCLYLINLIAKLASSLNVTE